MARASLPSYNKPVWLKYQDTFIGYSTGGKMATRAQTKTDQKNGARKAPMMVDSRNDLPENIRQQMVELLNKQLADTFDLYSQTKQAHWNVKGRDFYQLHELYDQLAEGVLAYVDMIAERATALGGVATGTARMAAEATRLPEFPAEAVGSMESVKLLVDRYAAAAQSTREAADQADEAKDIDTSDLLVEVSRDLDKFLWFLEAHLQKE
jgi:starvation-inducible DNA-binding protein